jgi:hypothetical protein
VLQAKKALARSHLPNLHSIDIGFMSMPPFFINGGDPAPGGGAIGRGLPVGLGDFLGLHRRNGLGRRVSRAGEREAGNCCHDHPHPVDKTSEPVFIHFSVSFLLGLWCWYVMPLRELFSVSLSMWPV